MEYYVNIKKAVTNLTNRIKLFSWVLTVILMGLLLYSCANGDEIESDKTEEIAEYEEQIDEITDFIDEQTELEVNTFQTNLLTWLNNKNNIQEATINKNKSLITVKLKNGLNYLIYFQDMAFFHDNENEQNSVTHANISRAEEKIDYYDVSYQDDEKIIEQNKLLYIQGMKMRFSNADKEKGLIKDRISESPIKCELTTAPRTQFLTENLKNYGIILISQTHGMKNYDDKSYDGSFIVAGSTKMLSNSNIYILYVKDNLIVEHPDREEHSIIKAQLLSEKLSGNKDAIIFGNYCWSFSLASKLKNTVYGYEALKPYQREKELDIFLTRMLQGDTFDNTYKYISEPYNWYDWFGTEVNPNTNNPNSKQRYFSISTDEITNTNANQPKITGKINGYKNLKKNELTYFVYFHEGDEDFSPESAKDDECIILKTPEYPNLTTFSINDDGEFSFDFPGWLMANMKYRIAFAFEYKDAIYYGERKCVVPEEKDNTLTNGELIDLGLSVKWASCNLGANAPNQLGRMYNIDFMVDAVKNHPELFNEDGTKANFCGSYYDHAYKLSAGRMRMPSYAELKELKEKCTWELSVIDDVAGVRIVGPNKNSIFMPAVTWKDEGGYWGYKITSYTLENTLYASGTYDRYLGPGIMSLCLAGLYSPQTPNYYSMSNDLMSVYLEAYIRPVGK